MKPIWTPSQISVSVMVLGFTLVTFSQAQQLPLIDVSRSAEITPTPALHSNLEPPNFVVHESILEDSQQFTPVTPGDDDIGQQVILKRQEDHRPFQISIDNNIFWTDNAANAAYSALDDWFMVSGVHMGYEPRLHQRFFGQATLSQQWYHFDQWNALDYEALNATTNLLAVMPELANSIWVLGYNYQNITQGLGSSSIYESHTLRFGPQKNFLINRLNSVQVQAFAALALDADPKYLLRHEYAIALGWTFKISRTLSLMSTARLHFYDYQHFAQREDLMQSYGLSLLWRPHKNVDISTSYQFTSNHSRYDAFDFESQLAGPSIAIKVHF